VEVFRRHLVGAASVRHWLRGCLFPDSLLRPQRMFNRPVVFVIGAGASADYCMPLGGTLATKIASDSDFWFDHSVSYRPSRGDADLFDILLRKFQNDRPAKV
jgi:hypothetical protein